MPSKNKVNYFFWFIRSLIVIYLYTLCRVKHSGRNNVPRKGGLIIASNHIAGADPFLMGSTVPRELYFMAKKELFRTSFTNWLFSRMNAFPVDRFGFDLEVIKKSIAMLNQNRALIMFPEGTRSKDGVLREGKIGVGMLARKAGVSIVPVYIENTGRAWFNFLRNRRLIVRFGEIIDSEWIKAQLNNKEGYKAITDMAMTRIRQLQQIQ